MKNAGQWPGVMSIGPASWGAVLYLLQVLAAVGRSVDQIRLKISVPFVPPKPKLFFAAYSIGIFRASLAQ